MISKLSGTSELLPTTAQGWTALIYACQKEDISSVQSLLKLEVNLNVCTKVWHFMYFTLIVLNSYTGRILSTIIH